MSQKRREGSGSRPGSRRRAATACFGLMLASSCVLGAAAPPDRPAEMSRADSRKWKALDYLTGEYVKQLASSDWITRAAATIGLSHMPTHAAGEAVLKQAEEERHVVGQVVAWQGVLARAGVLTDEQFARWEKVTLTMMRKDAFHGDLRIGLLEMLSARPITTDSRGYFRRLLAETSSLDSADIPTLIAMGRALRKWGDAELVELLLRALGSPHTAVRAELVLQAAGADVPWSRSPAASRVYAKWWKESKDDFTSRSPGEKAWKRLKAQFIPGPLDVKTFDPHAKKWRGEMELGKLQLGSFGFGIAIDCSRSMRPEIERLKRDMRVIFAALSLIAREVGVGITKFAPGRLVNYLPLTSDLNRLMAYVQAMDIFGPAGEEEWAGALQVTMGKSRWPAQSEHSRRAIVLISDEPITAPQGARCMDLARQGAKTGFRIYGVMIRPLTNVRHNPLSIPFDRTSGGSLFDAAAGGNPPPAGGKGGKGGKGWGYYAQIAEATGGRAITAEVPQGGLGLGMPLTGKAAKAAQPNKGGKGKKAKNKGKGGGKKQIAFSPVAVAPIYPGGGPTNKILTLALVDAISVHHADRIEPLVKVLVAYCQKAARRVPERRVWGPPDKMEPNLARRAGR